MDRIDQMLNMLGDAIPEVIWERDAADVARPEDWGAAELRQEPATQWADGVPTDRVWIVDLYMAVTDDGSDWADLVDAVMRRYDEEAEWITWNLASREYMPQIGKVLWQWQVRIYGPLEIPGETGG